MTYQQAIKYLYQQAPMFQLRGKSAYKADLEVTLELDKRYGHLHQEYATIHVGGTNGKGSTSHMLAAVLQCAGYKVGLYTSPHLKDFRERIRVNGEMIPEEIVCKYVEEAVKDIEELQPSFFEITTALAFKYFSEADVDVAVIEVGLGGLLDCTNIISPELSIITNISTDHTDILGTNILDIAKQKAGIIKKNTPIIIGERQSGVADIFSVKAKEMNTSIIFADERYKKIILPECEMKGEYQEKNIRTVLTALDILSAMGWRIDDNHMRYGIKNVCSLTGIMGRWQKINDNPRIICDTGHNEAGIKYITNQLKNEKYNTLRIVFGVVKDKDINKMLALLPKNAVYYFSNANIPRALNATSLMEQAKAHDLHGNIYTTIHQALDAAIVDSHNEDLIFVGGSNFTVAEII